MTAFVTNIVTPIIAAIGGKPDFSDLTFTINGSEFGYGAFINALIAFLIIAAVVFFFVIKPVNLLMARFQPDTAVDVQTRACPECLSDIPIRGDALRVLHGAGAGAAAAAAAGAAGGRRPSRA